MTDSTEHKRRRAEQGIRVVKASGNILFASTYNTYVGGHLFGYIST
jgi:hypothetical protein